MTHINDGFARAMKRLAQDVGGPDGIERIELSVTHADGTQGESIIIDAEMANRIRKNTNAILRDSKNKRKRKDTP